MAWFKRVTLRVSATLVAVALCCPVVPAAAAAGKWAELDPALGRGTGVCNRDGDRYACFALRCNERYGLEFALLANAGTIATTAEVSVDGQFVTKLELAAVELDREMVAPFEPDLHDALLVALKAGRSFAVDAGARQEFTLAGSSAKLDATKASCEAEQIPPPGDDAPLPPHSSLIDDGQGPDIEMSWGVEMKGGDYDSGATNPALAGLGYTDCRVMCQLDDRCKAYSYSGQARICSLKNSVGEKVPSAYGRAAIFVDRAEHAETRLVARTATEPAFDQTLTWQAGDTAETYVARTRAAAAPFGRACEEEMATLDGLKVSLQVNAPPQPGVAGKATEISWSGNTLTERIPVWIALSTASPARFSGKGFFAVNPGALAPFGIDIAKDETRAFIALTSRSAGTSGSLGVVPLLAGGMQLKSTVVAYLRACQQVVALSEQTFALDVRPAAPRIVVHDPYALNIYDHQAEIPAFSRKVLYNKERFLILDAELGSEILERNGTDLKFSPTRRYLSVRNDNATDVVDLVDGSVVARIGDSQSAEDALKWFHNDSFVAVARAPWGSAWLASTLDVQPPLYIYETSASCCNLEDDGLVDVNLENGLVRVQGGNAGMAADLQEFDMSVDYPGTQPFDDSFGFSSYIFLQSLGTVSPIPNSTGWNQPQPPAEGALLVTDDPAVIAAPPKAGGSSGTELAETRGVVSLVKPANDLPRRGVDLGPFGFELAPETAATSSLSPANLQMFSWEEYEEIDKIQSPVRGALSQALAAKKITVDWMTLTGDLNADINCDYIRTGDNAKPTELPGSLTLVQRVERQAGAVWILRSQCQGGGTGGTQYFKSSLMMIDESRLQGRPAREAIVEEHETQGTSFERVFHDYDFQTKLIGDHQILFVMPGNGAIGLFDLDTRGFVFKRENLPRGDLLADAGVSADGKFILQVNSDNSFALHRIGDASTVLEGRQVDGETVFWDADFRFDSTAEGASFVELRFPGQNGQYTLQQFDTRLRRQALLAAVLKGEAESAAVTVNVPPRLSGSLTAGNGRIAGEATPVSASPLKEIRLYQDGVLTNTFAAAASGSPVSIDAERLPGTRWVSLVAGDQEGLVSLPVGRDLGADDKLTKTHLLAIGIDSYDDPRLPRLHLAGKDAGSLRAALEGLNGKSIDLEASSTLVLTDAAASKAAILDAARRIVAEAAPGDNAVIFFAGHGLQGKDGRFYLGLSITAAGDVEGTALAWSELAGILSQAKGRVTVLLDACHSGTAGTGLLASNDQAVDSIRDAIPSGLTVLSASKGRELSAELASLGGGVFTSVLVEAIGKDRSLTDVNGNGRIEVSELYRFVKDKVSALRNGEQTPWLARNQMIGDFAIF